MGIYLTVSEGRMIYVNHIDKTTSWSRPEGGGGSDALVSPPHASQESTKDIQKRRKASPEIVEQSDGQWHQAVLSRWVGNFGFAKGVDVCACTQMMPAYVCVCVCVLLFSFVRV